MKYKIKRNILYLLLKYYMKVLNINHYHFQMKINYIEVQKFQMMKLIK